MGQQPTAGRLGTAGARDHNRHRTRAAGLGGLLAVPASTATLVLGRTTRQAWPGAGPVAADSALLSVSLTAATGLLAWVSVVLTLAALDLLRSHERPILPLRSVQWVSAALVAVTAAPATAASAGLPEPTWSSITAGASAGDDASHTDPPPTSDPGAATPPDALPDGSPVPLPGWTPAPAPVSPQPSTTVGLVSAVPQDRLAEHVVVRRGDSLWSIAARHLGPEATVQDVAEAWPRWYAANRGVIGPDPDLILPGQELTIPGPAPAGHDVGLGR